MRSLVTVRIGLGERLRQARCQLVQRTAIHMTLEENDFADRMPVIDPAIPVELGLGRGIETHTGFVGDELQHEPLLFLADAQRLTVATDIPLGQPVTQPVTRAAYDFDMLRTQTDFLFQLSIECCLGVLAATDAPLGKLPGLLSKELE